MPIQYGSGGFGMAEAHKCKTCKKIIEGDGWVQNINSGDYFCENCYGKEIKPIRTEMGFSNLAGTYEERLKNKPSQGSMKRVNGKLIIEVPADVEHRMNWHLLTLKDPEKDPVHVYFSVGGKTVKIARNPDDLF
jgi:hypothetical protein